MRPLKGAQINDLRCKLLICEERENDTFRFPWSKKPLRDFLRPYHRLITGKFPWTFFFPYTSFQISLIRDRSPGYTEGKTMNEAHRAGRIVPWGDKVFLDHPENEYLKDDRIL